MKTRAFRIVTWRARNPWVLLGAAPSLLPPPPPTSDALALSPKGHIIASMTTCRCNAGVRNARRRLFCALTQTAITLNCARNALKRSRACRSRGDLCGNMNCVCQMRVEVIWARSGLYLRGAGVLRRRHRALKTSRLHKHSVQLEFGGARPRCHGNAGRASGTGGRRRR